MDSLACFLVPAQVLPPDAHRAHAAVALNDLVELRPCDLAHGASPGGLGVTHLITVLA